VQSGVLNIGAGQSESANTASVRRVGDELDQLRWQLFKEPGVGDARMFFWSVPFDALGEILDDFMARMELSLEGDHCDSVMLLEV
jgi:hypothetical protein